MARKIEQVELAAAFKLLSSLNQVMQANRAAAVAHGATAEEADQRTMSIVDYVAAYMVSSVGLNPAWTQQHFSYKEMREFIPAFLKGNGVSPG